MKPSQNLKPYYRQKFPHIQRIGDTFFVTFRLFGSLPKSVIEDCKQRYHNRLNEIKVNFKGKNQNYEKFKVHRNYLIEYDNLLHSIKTGPKYLSDIQCAMICKEQFHRFDNKLYKLLAYTIMNNHVHLLIDTSVQLELLDFDQKRIEKEFQTLDKIMKRIKGASARYCNELLGYSGQFWEHENYDTYIRNERMLKNVISYILENPVKAGIVEEWHEYRWNYLTIHSEM